MPDETDTPNNPAPSDPLDGADVDVTVTIRFNPATGRGAAARLAETTARHFAAAIGAAVAEVETAMSDTGH
ncbi:MAG: hypothetical protein GY736_05865 [Sphingomonas sp.]|uniref:hypothetical protein n=1 Tax=Sphingomonas sp. TaxID=28214 RepID=UPI00258482C1|nr:hypothetical protein [Sphingomonas sp.]MCP4025825.1 hypothetical protein [Sphingomonas sp.]